jgi:hypothetical protein
MRNPAIRSVAAVCVAALCVASPAGAGEASVVLPRKPWSSTYWPLKECWMSFGDYSQGLAPFEKYDNYVQVTRGHNPGTAAREADPANGHNEATVPGAEFWTGHCHGWAPASLLEPEPPASAKLPFSHPVRLVELTIDDADRAKRGMSRDAGSAYRVRKGGPAPELDLVTADYKAMLCEVYTEVRAGFWGNRYNGRKRDARNPFYADIKPHQLHQLLIEHMQQKKQGLVIDADPSYMVWNQPVYRFESRWTETRVGVDVVTTLWWADDGDVDPMFHGTRTVKRRYTYTMKKNARGAITDSAWTGKSVHDHPDFVWKPEGVLDGENTARLELNVVREMISRAGQLVVVRDGAAPAPPSARRSGNLLGVRNSD